MTLAPAVTVWLAGTVVNEGAVPLGFTVSEAAVLMAKPAVLLTTTL